MATENYLLANYDDYKFLDNIGSSEYIYVMDLINEQYMDIDSLNPNNGSAFDSKDVVKVTRNQDNTFSYELMTTKTLIENLLEQYTPGNTTGLLVDESNPNIYYYKGNNEEVSNNYLWYGGHHWRVIEFDTSDDTLTLVSQQPLAALQPASSVWKTQNEYEESYVNNWLSNYFYNSLTSNIQNNIVDNTFNIGIYNNVNEFAITQKVGLLDENQYTRAGGADSYLDIKEYWWLGNRYNTTNLRYVSIDGNVYSENMSPVLGIRAIIKISDVAIVGGNGTLYSNYEVGRKATSINDIQIGEYINVPYNGNDNACGSDNKCTFRVIDKDSDSIKVVLNGILPNTSTYGNSTTITTSHTVYTPLNTFANNISNAYRYTNNKVFYIGDYPHVLDSGQNYEDVKDETLLANVGLPTIGELFSANDIDLSDSVEKIFVNSNTLENPIDVLYYWTMNRYSSTFVRGSDTSGYLFYVSPSISYGVRPVIFLKNNLEFISGKGTAEAPYELQ